MQVYLVGGAVRDMLLGVPSHDLDYVVVGAGPDEMLKLGFKQVGADFPVFLHPRTGAEYALARIERKVGPGYRGFEVVADGTVTLEDDLKRRDLTINSMALKVNDMSVPTSFNDLVDPYGGVADLAERTLRHTSEAFREDPLRVLRLARFCAKLPNFSIAPETVALCNEMIESGELATLTQERVWQEVYKVFDSAKPQRFFDALTAVDAFQRVPGLRPLAAASAVSVTTLLQLTAGVANQADVVIGALIARAERPAEPLLRGLNSVALKVAKLIALPWDDFRPEPMLESLTKSGALRDGWALTQAALKTLDAPDMLEGVVGARAAVLKVSAAQFPNLEGKELGDALKAARLQALNDLWARDES